MKLTTGIGVLFAAMAVMFEPEWVRHPIPACFVMSLVGFVFLLELGGDKDAKRVINWISDDEDGKSWQRDFYERSLGGALDWLDTHLNPEALERGDDPRCYSRAWGWRLYDKCLFLALLYPLVFLFISWVFSHGNAVVIGDYKILTKNNSTWSNYSSPLIALMSIIIIYLSNKKIKIPYKYILITLILTIQIAYGREKGGNELALFLIISAYVIMFLYGVKNFQYISYSLAAFGAIIIGYFGSGAASTLLTGLSCIIFIYIFNRIIKNNESLYLPLFVLFITEIYTIALIWSDQDQDLINIFIFLGLLPLVNAQFDFLSSIATRNLLRRGVQAGPWGQIGWGLLDFGIGIGLFIALSATALAHGANLLSGQALINLPAIFSNPSAHYWLFFAFLTTLLPTFIHAILWILSFLTLWPKFIREKFRKDLIAYSANDGSEMDAHLAKLGIASIFAVTVTMTLSLFYLLWLGVNNAGNVGSAILRLCEWVYLTLDTHWPSIAPPAI